MHLPHAWADMALKYDSATGSSATTYVVLRMVYVKTPTGRCFRRDEGSHDFKVIPDSRRSYMVASCFHNLGIIFLILSTSLEPSVFIKISNSFPAANIIGVAFIKADLWGASGTGSPFPLAISEIAKVRRGSLESLTGPSLILSGKCS
jgi:hypothetical protein